jgi:hypothetical protein
LGLFRTQPEKKDNRQADRHAKLGQKKEKNGKSVNGKSAVQETEKLTDEQTDILQFCKCWDTLIRKLRVVVKVLP